MMSNESGAKSKADHEKAAAWLQRVIQSGTKKLILFLVILKRNELISTSSDTPYSQEVIQNDNENESFEDNAENDSGNDLSNDSGDDNESNNANKEDKAENVSANKKKAIAVSQL